MADQLTAADVHQQVHDLRARATVPPTRIELGVLQREAIEAEVRTAAGTNDIGPLTEYNGLPIVRSRRQDHVKLLAADDSGDDVEVEQVTASAPSGPDAPVESEPGNA